MSSSQWQKLNFGDVATLKRDSVAASEIGDDDAYVGLEHIEPNALRLAGVGRGADVSSAKLRFQPGDILFGKLRPYFRKVVYSDLTGVCSTDIWVLNARQGVDSKYLFYVVANQPFVDFVNSGASGTRMPRANWKHALGYPIFLPPVDEQKAIAEVLGALDERVQRARQLQLTIRQVLAAEFQQNFTSGSRVSVADVAETVPGRSYKTAELSASPVGLVNLKNIPRFGGFEPDGTKGYVGKFKPAQELSPGDLVVAHTDMTQNGDVVGRVGRVRPCPPFTRMVASMDLVVVRPSTDWMTSEFLHEVLSTPRYVAYAKSHANGTTVLHLKKDSVPSFTFDCPEPDDVARFTEFAVPLWEMHDQAEAEADAASRVRDALLPRLVSGEVRIPDPEALLGPVG